MSTAAEVDARQADATREELRGYLTYVGERMSALRNVIVSDPRNPATLGRLDAHVIVMQAILDALAFSDHMAAEVRP
jgi:hypothetical protein